MRAVAEDEPAEDYQRSRQRKILIAIDDNRACEDAVEWALREFYRYGCMSHCKYSQQTPQRSTRRIKTWVYYL
jgi:hypothetical protein